MVGHERVTSKSRRRANKRAIAISVYTTASMYQDKERASNNTLDVADSTVMGDWMETDTFIRGVTCKFTSTFTLTGTWDDREELVAPPTAFVTTGTREDSIPPG